MWNIKTLTEHNNNSTYGDEIYYRTSSSETGGWNIHLPSMSKPTDLNDTYDNNYCEAGLMKVYDDKVIIT
jgi:hypothetical protein